MIDKEDIIAEYEKQLQEKDIEIERLANELNKCMIERNNFLSRNEKAIEYIEQIGSKTKVDDTMAVINFVREIKNILKGEDNE